MPDDDDDDDEDEEEEEEEGEGRQVLKMINIKGRGGEIHQFPVYTDSTDHSIAYEVSLMRALYFLSLRTCSVA
jgi:hypothetical protein